jgi:MoxR-like ATPase
MNPVLRAAMNELVKLTDGNQSVSENELLLWAGAHKLDLRTLIPAVVRPVGNARYRVASSEFEWDGVAFLGEPVILVADEVDPAPPEALPLLRQGQPVPLPDTVQTTASAENLLRHEELVPKVVPEYVPVAYHDDLLAILKSRQTHNVQIMGETGCGKTFPVEQICALLKREMVLVSISNETDEDDLFGGLRLINGNSQYELGPVPIAMQRGAVLVLDEMDQGSTKLMCLQPVLEGKPVLIKKIGKMIFPAPGFTVVATTNTKGLGDGAGRYAGAQIMNEAFLERFPITVEANFPEPVVERKIITNELTKLGMPVDKTMVARWVEWANMTRQTFKDGGIMSLISTRRLVFMSRSYAVFKGNEAKALAYSVNRFDTDTQKAMKDLFDALKVQQGSKANDASAGTGPAEETEDFILKVLTQPVATS